MTVAGSAGAWPDLDALPGVRDAVAEAREAIASVRRLPANRQGWPKTAAAAAIRAARASAMLDGGSATVRMAAKAGVDAGVDSGAGGDRGGGPADRAAGGREAASSSPSDIITDPVLAGALRVSAAIGELAAVWERAPLQALARLHTLAAADLVPADRLGRPRPDADLGSRLALLADAVTGAPWTAPVLIAVVHGELLALRPFGSADGVVARAAARLTLVATGLDPQALTVPEVGHLRAGERYALAAAGFATGAPDAVAAWIGAVCAALKVGAREARSIAVAAVGGTTPELRHSRHHGHIGG